MGCINFWEKNINPVTMYFEKSQNCNSKNNKLKERYYLKKSEFSEERYMTATQAKSLLGVGFKRINGLIKDNLDVTHTSFLFNQITYYEKDHIESIVKILNEIKIRKTNIVTSDYISSVELKKSLNINSMQLFILASRYKWKKFKFEGNGNIKFFLRSQVLNQKI